MHFIKKKKCRRIQISNERIDSNTLCMQLNIRAFKLVSNQYEFVSKFVQNTHVKNVHFFTRQCNESLLSWLTKLIAFSHEFTI